MKSRKRGHILAFVLAVMGMIFILVTIVLQLVHTESYSAQRSYVSRQALNLAEAGIEHAIRELNSNSSYTGGTDIALGEGTFSVSVTGTGGTRTIESTGHIPNSTNPLHSRIVRAEASLNAESVEFFYGIQVDAGGISMGNNAFVDGNVYSNGSIVGLNGATITGDVTVAGGIGDAPTVSWTTENDDHLFATDSSNRDIAQSFIASETGTLGKVAVYIGKVGNPTSNLQVRVQADDGDKPSSGSTLAQAVIAYTAVGLTSSWIEVPFAFPTSVTNGVKYWIVVDYGANSSVNHWKWRKDTSDSYANNTGKTTNNWSAGSAVWTSVGGDLAFRAWIGGTANRIENMIIGDATTGTGRANLFVSTTIHGSSCPNQYCITENPPQEALPLSDGVIADWKVDALGGGIHSGDYILTNGAVGSLGPKKIEGNLTIDNGALLTITGSLWVTGNVVIQNNAIARLDSGYGTNSGLIVADGTIHSQNNAVFEGVGGDSYILLLTTRDAKTEVSITVDNNALGVIYYAARSRIRFLNNASAKEATAWGIDLDNNAFITYESGLANTNFTSGPGGGWQLKKGSWRQIQ